MQIAGMIFQTGSRAAMKSNKQLVGMNVIIPGWDREYFC
ncbi:MULTISPECIES: hypothetical protein [Clostridia]